MNERLRVSFGGASNRDEAMNIVEAAADRWFGDIPWRIVDVNVSPDVIISGDGGERVATWNVDADIRVERPAPPDPGRLA